MMSQALTIARKDIKTEFRAMRMIFMMIIFSLMVIMAFRFAFDFYEPELDPLVAPILWITFTFAGMLGLLSSFSKEKDRGSLDGLMLCPMDRSAIFFGKVISNFLLILLVDIFTLIFFALFFSFDYHGNIVPLFIVIFIGTLSFVVIGTLLSGISAPSRSREVLLPILLIPSTILTVLLPSIIASSEALDGNFNEAVSMLRTLVMFAVIYIALGYLLFNYVVEE